MEFWQHVAFLETDQLVEVARKAEEVGVTGVVTADHQVFPRRLVSKYPYTPDPVPMFAGGISDAAIHRAVTLCDGWLGEGARDLDEVLQRIQRVQDERADSPRANEPFTILTAVGSTLTPGLARRLEDAGVTGLVCAPWMTAEVIKGNFRSSVDVKLRAIEQFAQDVIAKV